MNPAPLLSIVSGALALLLSVIFYFQNSNVQSRSGELQEKQEALNNEQRNFQNQQQIFQAAQQRVQNTNQLMQVGNQVLTELAVKGRDTRNEKIKKLLEKYDLKLQEAPAETPKAADTPKPNLSPAPAAPATPKP